MIKTQDDEILEIEESNEDIARKTAKRSGLIPMPIIWWPLIWGVLLILTAISLEHGLWVYNSGVPLSAEALASQHPKSMVFNHHVPILVISEVGYALLIAWVVSIAIEAASRKEHNEAVEESRRAISKDVFRGVYGIRHDPAYVKAVISTCLEETLMRENYSISYKIEEPTAAIREAAGDKADTIVQVTVTARYDLRNVGPSDNNYTSAYGIPIREGALAEHAKVTLMKIGTDSFEGAILEDMSSKGEDGDVDYRFSVNLGPQESKEILIEAVLIKDLSDSDTFGFRRPTTGATIRLDVNVNGLIFGASERTASPMKVIRAPTPGRTAEWKIAGPILPYNSVVLWWRPASRSGTTSENSEGQDGVTGEP